MPTSSTCLPPEKDIVMSDRQLERRETVTGAMVADHDLEHSSPDWVDHNRETENSILISGVIANNRDNAVNHWRPRREEARLASREIRNPIRASVMMPTHAHSEMISRHDGPKHVSHSLVGFWPEDDFRVDEGVTASLGLPDHLVPFIPYIEKCALSYSPDIELDVATNQRKTTDTIRNWIGFCDSKHSVCQSHRADEEVHASAPHLLINVFEMCITRNTTGADYVALSYVWGTGESFCTTTDNLEALLQPQSLERQPFIPPRTILDAMKLVQDIGERYLWVDRYVDSKSTRIFFLTTNTWEDIALSKTIKIQSDRNCT